jgi:hypothetical protein
MHIGIIKEKKKKTLHRDHCVLHYEELVHDMFKTKAMTLMD